MTKIITNHTGGRLANQLYFVLQAFIQCKRQNIDCKYTVIDTYNFVTDIRKYAKDLNIENYVSYDNSHIDEIQPFNQYYQEFEKDFTEDELNEFIDETLLKSELIQKYYQINKDNYCITLHIRNGDYKNISIYNCFDKREYLVNAINSFPKDIENIVVFGDENSVSKELYDDILKKRFKNIIYKDSDMANPLNDFCELCSYKNKILWNSTFSYWTGFVADRLYDNKNIIVCPKLCWNFESSISRTKNKWIRL